MIASCVFTSRRAASGSYLFEMIDDSFSLVVKGLRKAEKMKLDNM